MNGWRDRTVSGRHRVSEEIAGFNLAIEHTPEIVVGIESANDAREVIQFATESHLKIAVQSTGHGAHAPITSES